MRGKKVKLSLVIACSVAAQILYAGPEEFSLSKGMDESKLIVKYEVNKSVSEFADKEDFSTPESAYAAINRVMATGGSKADWNRVSGKSSHGASTGKREIASQEAKIWLNANIVEVNVYLGRTARVFAEVQTASGDIKYDQRSVIFKEGQWFNSGQDGLADSLEEARANFDRKKDRLHPMHNELVADETLKYAKEHPEEILTAAETLFDTLRMGDFENVQYTVMSNWPAWSGWVHKTFKDAPIVSVELGELFQSDVDFRDSTVTLPSVPYKLALKNGEILAGKLPFKYHESSKQWYGIHGLDWHLKYPRGLSAPPVSVLLEEGIYTEETVGNRERAIEIYRRIVIYEKTNRKYIAEALFRLGRCLAEEGHETDALVQLKKLTTHYSDQKELLSKANELIAELAPKPMFPELDGCRLKHTIRMTLGKRSAKANSATMLQYPGDISQVVWAVAPELEGRVDHFRLYLVPEDDRKVIVEYGTALPSDARNIPSQNVEAMHIGKHTVRLVAFGADDAEIARCEQAISVEPAMYSQMGVNDIQPDGIIRFTSATLTPDIWQETDTRGFINSDFVHIEEMFDENGDPVEFNETHEGNIYRYSAQLNKTIYKGQTLFLGSKGWKEDMIRQHSDNKHIYRMNHTPGANTPVRRIEMFRLPKGAELISTNPSGLPHRELEDGRIEVLVDTVIPTGGSLLTEFSYRYERSSNKYLDQITQLIKNVDSEEKKNALEQIEKITVNATFHLGALVKLAELIPDAEFNHQRIVKAAELASWFGYHTGALTMVAELAAKAPHEYEEFDEILELIVLSYSNTWLLTEIAKEFVTLDSEEGREALRAKIKLFRDSYADFQTIEEGLKAQEIKWPSMKGTLARYKMMTAGQTPTLTLEPAPWPNGEVLRYRLVSGPGMEIGHHIWTANQIDHEGKACWKIEQRLLVPINNATIFSKVIAEKETFQPIHSISRNAMGQIQADYSNDQVVLKRIGDESSSTTVDLSDVTFDNEQALFLMRRLPLKEGYKAEFPVMSVFGGSTLTVKIEVVKRDKITVPAGVFDSYKIKLGVYSGSMKAMEQDFWISVKERLVVKMDTGPVDIELVSHSVGEESKVVTHNNEVEVTLPKNWFGYVLPKPGANSEIVRFLSPEMSVEGTLLKTIRHPSTLTVDEIASKDIEALEGYFENYTVRPESVMQKDIHGSSVYIFEADYEVNDENMVEFRAYYVSESSVYWLVFRVDADKADAVRSDVQYLMRELQLQRKYGKPTPFILPKKFVLNAKSVIDGVSVVCKANIPESKELEGSYTTPFTLKSHQKRLDVTFVFPDSGKLRFELNYDGSNPSWSGEGASRVRIGKNMSNFGYLH